MLFAGCKTDVNNASVFCFVQTKALINDIKQLTNSEAKYFDISDHVNSQCRDYSRAKAFFIEVHTPESVNDTLELIKIVRQRNQVACIFILVTHTKSFSSISCYLAGADHCLKLPVDPQDKLNLLTHTLKDSHWKTTAQLHLDRTRLMLYDSTRKLEISYTEMTIIDALIQAPEHVMSQDSIAKTLDPNIIFYDPRALEKTISRLRTKIKKTYNLEIILSVRAYGYRLRRGTVSG